MIKFNSPLDLQKVFPTEQHYTNYLERHRWNGIILSPYDPTSKVYKLADGWYKCKNTGKRFNVKTGTIFKGTRISLQIWFWALYNLVNRKKGTSSHQLSRETGITQKSAWVLLKNLRKELKQSNFIKDMLKNEVEADETFIGGKNKNRHKNKKVPNSQGRSWKDKTPVLGMLERNGILITSVVPNTQQETLEPIIRANIKEGATIYTDEWKAYNDLYKWFSHQRVNHGAKQYVNGKAHTNSIENFWSHLKGGIRGTYHNVSKKYLQGYVDEATFRFNTRKNGEQEKFDLVLLSIVGKKPTYQQLINN